MITDFTTPFRLLIALDKIIIIITTIIKIESDRYFSLNRLKNKDIQKTIRAC